MLSHETRVFVHRSVVEALTVDAMVLADEVETYFGVDGDQVLEGLAPAARAEVARAAVARAGLRISVQLTRLVDWLVWRDGNAPAPLPSEYSAEPVEVELPVEILPPRVRALFAAAQLIFDRAEALDDAPHAAVAVTSPARMLQERLARAING